MHKETNVLCALYYSLQICYIGDTKFYVVVLLYANGENDVEH
jgi:hypothetical protein